MKLYTESEVDAANKELQLSKEALTKDITTYKSDMNNQIYENKTTIANLKSDLNQQNMPYEEGREAKISELELRNSEMEIKINNYNDENKDNWDKFKTEFDQDMNSMKNSFQGLNVTN